MKIRFWLKATVVIAAMMLPTAAHARWNDSIRYVGQVEATFAGGEHNPFWMAANKYGLSSVTRNNAYLRVGVFHDMDKSRRFTWGAGADIAGAIRYTSPFIVQQLYGEVKYRCLNFLAGSKEIPGYTVDSELSTGNLLYSGNSRPIPQLRAGIFDYADIYFTQGWLALRGYAAFGKFTDNRWIESWVDPKSKYNLGMLYHSKSLWLRAGNVKKFPLEFEIGIEMGTQFGGTTYDNGKVTKFPTKFIDWFKIVIPKSGGSGTPQEEQANIEGNVVGSWNFSLAWKPQKDWMVKLYYMHMFEDHSMLWIQYPWKDGLYGVQAKFPSNRWVSEAVYEFMYTKDQSGSVYWDRNSEIDHQVSGRDNYFNHRLYNGWQHWGMGIGNPLLISPIYNADHTLYFQSNRLWSHHIGIKGNPTRAIGYKLLATYSRHWGTYDKPLENAMSEFNMLAEICWKPEKAKGWAAHFGVGMDAGKLLGNSYGVSLKLTKTGWFLK